MVLDDDEEEGGGGGGGLKDHTGTLESGVPTLQPQGKNLHMKVKENRSYLCFTNVNAN